MGSSIYSGFGGDIYRATEGRIMNLDLTIPAGTLLAQTPPIMSGHGGVYRPAIMCSSYGGTKGTLTVHLERHPALTGGLDFVCGENTSLTPPNLADLPMPEGAYLTLTTIEDCRADWVWGSIRCTRQSVF